MFTPTPEVPNAEQLALLQKKLQLEASARNGTNWFYWIAGLSVLNSIIYFLGGNLTFVVGLGATQFIEGVMVAIAKEVSASSRIIVHLLGFGLDIGVTGIFVAAGYFGRKRYRWVVITGMVLYALDALIFLLVKGWLAIVFHGVALWGLWRGLSAINQLKALEKSVPALASKPIPATLTVSAISNGTEPKWLTTGARIILILLLLLLAITVIFVTFILIRNG